jgi:hypothetical protein
MPDVPRCHSCLSMPPMATRCILAEGHGTDLPDLQWFHQGHGWALFPEQRIDWMPNDRRATTTDRTDTYAWMVG